jgi:hypothetical protein
VTDTIEYPPTTRWDWLGRKVFRCENCGHEYRDRHLPRFVAYVRGHVKGCWF